MLKCCDCVISVIKKCYNKTGLYVKNIKHTVFWLDSSLNAVSLLCTILCRSIQWRDVFVDIPTTAHTEVKKGYHWFPAVSQTIGLGGVELKHAAAGWTANLIQGITSWGGFYSSNQEGMLSKWLSSCYTQPFICNAIMMLENTEGEMCVQQLAYNLILPFQKPISMNIPSLKSSYTAFFSSSPIFPNLVYILKRQRVLGAW